MKVAILLLSCLCALLYTHPRAQPAGWRGIVPLHSTRADVERVLGTPNLSSDVYDLGNERASIMYSTDPCTGGPRGGYRVPRDTVLSIYVVPQYDLLLSALHFDPDKYKRTKDAPVPGHSIYKNEGEGVTYLVDETSSRGKSLVQRILYAPAAEDAGRRCPDATAEQTVEKDHACSPEGECPMIWIKGPTGEPCQNRRLTFTTLIVGVDPRFAATYKWSVSDGTITKGQGTSEIEVDVSNVSGKPVTATLEVGCVIPKGCTSTKTYTTVCNVNCEHHRHRFNFLS